MAGVVAGSDSYRVRTATHSLPSYCTVGPPCSSLRGACAGRVEALVPRALEEVQLEGEVATVAVAVPVRWPRKELTWCHVGVDASQALWLVAAELGPIAFDPVLLNEVLECR